MSDKLHIANPDHGFNKVRLVNPTSHHYLMIAAEVDRFILPFQVWTGRTKRILLKQLAEISSSIKKLPGMVDVTLFRAAVIPPGRGALLARRKGVHIARFDVVLLIEASDEHTLNRFKKMVLYRDMQELIMGQSSYVKILEATNVKSIGPVAHQQGGVFLFNYFYADDHEKNVAVWEYTAGWFQQITGLDNSTVLLPSPPDNDYTLINHCRWDRMRDILPSLMFKRSFRTFVLKNFFINGVAPMPILYRIVSA